MMRAKIIADVVAVVCYLLFMNWWANNVPFAHPAPIDQPVGQTLATIVTVLFVLVGTFIAMWQTIRWIHKG